MEKAVDVAESNMARFGLTQQEVASRKKWVTKTRQQASTSMKRNFAIVFSASSLLVEIQGFRTK